MRIARTLSLVAALASMPVFAEQWSCAYQPGAQPMIACDPVVARAESLEPVVAPLWGVSTRAPASTRGLSDRVLIPLHVAPREMSRVEFLARDVMCGRRADCEVRFGARAILASVAP